MSNGGGGGGEGALALLVLVVIFLPIALGIWLLWEIGKYLDDHPEEVAEFFTVVVTVVGWILLAPHYAVAMLVLFLCRDLVVQSWPVDYGEEEERTAIVTWLAILPVLLGLGWLSLTILLFSLIETPLALAVLLGTISTVTTLGTYYYLYFERPPQHHKWPLFLAQEETLRFNLRLAYVERRAQLQLWWRGLNTPNK